MLGSIFTLVKWKTCFIYVVLKFIDDLARLENSYCCNYYLLSWTHLILNFRTFVV